MSGKIMTLYKTNEGNTNIISAFHPKYFHKYNIAFLLKCHIFLLIQHLKQQITFLITLQYMKITNPRRLAWMYQHGPRHEYFEHLKFITYLTTIQNSV